MNSRPDYTDKLVHFTSGVSEDDAFERLRNIIDETRLVGSGQRIRGNYPCVCFTEAPLTSLPHGLVNPSAYSRYSAFGILFEKRWIFDQGGRPVVYQSDAEFDLLPEAIKWRHMRYEPGVVDFSWEREWRVQCDELSFAPNVAAIVVPEKRWANILVSEHDARESFEIYQYAQVVDAILAEQFRDPYPWRIYVLR